VGVKGVKWKRGYAYIRSMGRDYVVVEHTYLFFTSTTPRRWTAITMGALRYQTAIGSLSTASVPISTIFLSSARGTGSPFSHPTSAVVRSFIRSHRLGLSDPSPISPYTRTCSPIPHPTSAVVQHSETTRSSGSSGRPAPRAHILHLVVDGQ
jgi:hypothetical protein